MRVRNDYLASENRSTPPGAKRWRDLAIVVMHSAGKGPASIAVRLGLNCPLVTTTLREHGFYLPDWPYERHDPRNAVKAER